MGRNGGGIIVASGQARFEPRFEPRFVSFTRVGSSGTLFISAKKCSFLRILRKNTHFQKKGVIFVNSAKMT